MEQLIKNAIADIVILRREAHGDIITQATLNSMLDKLYDMLYELHKAQRG